VNFRRMYYGFRVAGYILGLTGMALWMAGRSGDGSGLLTRVGAACLFLMFCCLTGTYVVAMVRPRRTRPPRPLIRRPDSDPEKGGNGG